MHRVFKNLTVQVLTAITLGALIGFIWPGVGVALGPLGDGFIRLVKMVVGPIVFLTLVCGIGGMGDLKKVGRVGGKALLYFEVVTTLALVIGLLVANIVGPGRGFNANAAAPTSQTATAATEKVTTYSEAAKKQTTSEFLLNIIPDNIIGAFAKGELLQILFFSVLFGVAVSMMGEHGKGILGVCESLTVVMFKIVAIVMKVAPLGALGAMAFTIGKHGLGALVPLAKLMACVYLTMGLFVLVVLGGVCRFYGFRILKFIAYIREEILLVVGTSSSESALPRMIEKLQQAGCSKAVVGLVVPAGYSFNLDGTSIYLSMAAIFIAQAYGIDLTLAQELSLLGVLLLTSKGAAAVTGGGFITLAATLAATHTLPVEGLALLLGVDRFMSEARAVTNLIGNGVATVVVSKMEREVDEATLARELRL